MDTIKYAYKLFYLFTAEYLSVLFVGNTITIRLAVSWILFLSACTYVSVLSSLKQTICGSLTVIPITFVTFLNIPANSRVHLVSFWQYKIHQ